MKILVPVKRVVDYNVKVRAKSDERRTGSALKRLTDQVIDEKIS